MIETSKADIPIVRENIFILRDFFHQFPMSEKGLPDDENKQWIFL